MGAVSGQDIGGLRAAGLGEAIRATAGDIAVLLRGATDTGAPVPGSRWSVGEVAAHLAQANELMADVAAGKARPYGDGTPAGLAEANEVALAAFTERGAGPLAAMIVEQADAFLDAAARRPAPRGELVSPMGPMSMDVLGSYLLTHMLGHGYDLARALRRPHMVSGERAALCLPFLMVAMDRVVGPAAAGHTARYTIRLGGGARFGATFTDGAVAVDPRPPGRPDCTILMEPVAFLLVALGRLGPWGALARGRVVAWGRKPWLAPRFPTLFTPP
ncbi:MULTISPECIES: maleylpyruvate isomerase family mycothiol-dependent enzyme [unclassified Streptomyces]|uniref:maleylpyruvate isomerase family mycothiol-dependent enzyme n=1 Tax=unclassified Streptomyces TaxID=2593676 RepID=UPI00336AE5B9